jgi:hypothetical protein
MELVKFVTSNVILVKVQLTLVSNVLVTDKVHLLVLIVHLVCTMIPSMFVVKIVLLIITNIV